MLPNLFATSQSHSTNAEVAQVAPKSVPKTVYDWANFFATQPSTVRQLFNETIKIVQMLLVVPASAASAERRPTFSLFVTTHGEQ